MRSGAGHLTDLEIALNLVDKHEGAGQAGEARVDPRVVLEKGAVRPRDLGEPPDVAAAGPAKAVLDDRVGDRGALLGIGAAADALEQPVAASARLGGQVAHVRRRGDIRGLELLLELGVFGSEVAQTRVHGRR